jgi:hypothetical protein
VFFFARNRSGDVARNWLGGGIPITRADVQYHVAEDGKACLKLNQPSLEIDVSIWCPDGNALSKALSGFWGATDKDAPA